MKNPLTLVASTALALSCGARSELLIDSPAPRGAGGAATATSQSEASSSSGGSATAGAGGFAVASSAVGSGGSSDPCVGVVCDSPPAPSCVSASTLRTWSTPGSCAQGACSYVATDAICALGCAGGACTSVVVSAGSAHTCALTSKGEVLCWGKESLVPAQVLGVLPGVVSVSVATGIALYDQQTCVVTSTGAVQCWGYADPTPTEVLGFSAPVVSVSTGGGHACAVTSQGAVQCWGSNGHGELGNDSKLDSSTPVDVVGLSSGVVSVSTGDALSCAVTSLGGIKCWGADFFGQLGDGKGTGESKVPVDVVGLSSGAISVSAGINFACAVTSAGGAKCWGYGQYGQLGTGAPTISPVPVDVSGLTSGVSEIAASSYYNVCALTAVGGVKCWGASDEGELGNGSTMKSFVPVDVTGLTSGVVAISVGAQHACAVTSAGGISCWGRDQDGELGDGMTTNSAVPVEVVGF